MISSSNLSTAQASTANFLSEHGWAICLPLGWNALPKCEQETNFGLNTIEVFAHPNDPSLSLTWMCSSSQFSIELLERFAFVSKHPGLIPPAEAQSLISSVFPLMGRVVTAYAVQLADGQPAIELTEEIQSFAGGAEPLRAYHLLFPARGHGKESGPGKMQQLVFYARQSKFSQEIVGVIQSARSFQIAKFQSKL